MIRSLPRPLSTVAALLAPLVVALLAITLLAPAASAQTAIRVQAPDALRAAMPDLVAGFAKSAGGRFKLEPSFGGGPDAGTHVYIAADPASARQLADSGRTRGPAVVFARGGGGEMAFVVMRDAPPAAGELAGFLRFGDGRAILQRHGFKAP